MIDVILPNGRVAIEFDDFQSFEDSDFVTCMVI
jgi:hypothetical protein